MNKDNSSRGCNGHEWFVFTTFLSEVWIGVQCINCGVLGAVKEPTKTEWGEAFHAPGNPYRWSHGDDRVTVDPQGRYDAL